MHNSRYLRDKLARGETCLGTAITLSDWGITEAIAPDVDLLWIDMEHTSLSLDAVRGHLLATKGTRCASLVRVPWNDPVLIKPVLDAGADGIIVPMVRTADDVRRAVAACLYPPKGIRGFGPMRPSQYGRIGAEEVCRAGDESVMPIVQIEHVDAVHNIREILAVEGLFSVAFGPNDLAASMGHTGRPRDPEVIRAMETVIAAANEANIPVGISIGADPVTLAEWANKGIRWLSMGVDVMLAMQALGQVTADVRQRIKPS